ncbi:MAG: SpoIIE family protein phosphatase [Clostridia bacterium]|nr:SpoIIE family protein phosphatase [Clostridia bacterium]
MELAGRIAGRIREISKGEAVGFCLGLVLGMGGTWELSPLGPACACAGRMLGRRWGPALGAMAGAALFRRWTGLAQTAVFMALCLIWEGCTRPRRRDYTVLMICAAILIAPLFYIDDIYDAMTGLAQLSGALLFSAAFTRFGRAVSRMRLGKAIGERELTAMLITLGGLCGGGSALCLMEASLGGIIAALGTVLMCCTGGAYGVAAAAVSGAGLVLGGYDISIVGAMVIAALAACRLERRGYVCGAYFMAMGFSCHYGGCGIPPIAEAALGAGICLLLPEKMLEAMKSCLDIEGAARKRLQGMEGRVKDAATILDRVSNLLEDCPESEAELFAGRQLRCMSEAMTAIPEISQGKLKYRMECGGASCPKEGSCEAGDSMAAREIGGGKLVIISDGMGSGASARRESRAAVSLVGDLMSIGVKELDALDCVNRLLICKGEYDMYATLDAMTFDYVSGTARFIKLGAPPTYILRQGEVTELRADTLPIGIVEAIRPARKELMLRPGDAVIMATDGITDALGEGMIAAIASLGKEKDPREMARLLLMRAMSKSRNDDMSVMVGVVS